MVTIYEEYVPMSTKPTYCQCLARNPQSNQCFDYLKHTFPVAPDILTKAFPGVLP